LVDLFSRGGEMSFMTTQPAALVAAASKLQTLGAAMAAQNAAAATATTGVTPAAADEVSALQATQFSAYGTWYQQVSAQATAIHQMLVNMLGTSAGSYGQTEAANQSATGSTSLSGLTGASAASATSAAPTAASTPSLSSILSDLGGGKFISTTAGATLGTPIDGAQNFGAAASDFIALGQGQFLPTSGSSSAAYGLADDVVGAELPAAVAEPAGSAGVGAAPVLAGMGQAAPVGELSVPPSWAAGDVPAVTSAPATLAGAGWTSAAPQAAPVTAMPAGMPAVASAGRGSFQFGAPRYGAKPTVMPKPAVV
jgi:hypothetical protein